MPTPSRQTLEEFANRFGDALAAALKERRVALGMTRAQLEESTGLSERMLIFIENCERRLSVHSLILLCRALDVEVSQLMAEVETKMENPE